MRKFMYAALSFMAGALIATFTVAYAGESVTEEHRTYQEEHSETVHQAAPAIEKRTTETKVKQRAANDDDNDDDNRDDVDIKVKTEHHD